MQHICALLGRLAEVRLIINLAESEFTEVTVTQQQGGRTTSTDR